MHPADRLDARIATTGSVACVGLDPRPSLLPPTLRDRIRASHGPGPDGVAEAFRVFNEAIVDAVADTCACVKPQAACYEAYGAAGWRALEQTVTYAESAGVPVIVDAKRGDIGSTATHYGQMAFGGAPGLDDRPVHGMHASWMTVNPYLGADGVLPLLDDREGGVFVLVRTSNPSSADLQDAAGGAGTVSEVVADLVHRWGTGRRGDHGLAAVGAVVAATHPDDARTLRDRMPDTIFLVPGYGAQGASGEDALAGVRADGRGVVVAASRSIIGAWQHARTDDWAAAARSALATMNADLDAARP